MKHLLLFDGACGICTRASEIAKRIDRRGQFVIEPYQAHGEAELNRWGLSYPQCERKLQVVTGTGKVRSGAFGVNYFLWHQFPWTILVFVIYALPILLLIELAVYSLVARHRHRISAALGLKACTPRTPPNGER